MSGRCVTIDVWSLSFHKSNEVDIAFLTMSFLRGSKSLGEKNLTTSDEETGQVCERKGDSSVKIKSMLSPSTSPDASTRRNTSDNEAGYTIDQAIDKLGFGPFQLMIYLFSSLLLLADAMEMMILSVLSPAVKCQWSLSSTEEAIITSVVFIGFFFGSIFWGIMGDNFGRKRAILGMILVILISGVLSALKLTPDDARIPGYPWMLLCRFGVGFGASGLPQASTYFQEFLPLRIRGFCTTCLGAWWAFGTTFGAVLALGVMRQDQLGWHWYLGLSAIPIAVSLCFIPFIPESARLNLSMGKKKEAANVLKKIAWYNFTSLPPGELLTFHSSEENQREEDIRIQEDVRETESVSTHLIVSYMSQLSDKVSSEKISLLNKEKTTEYSPKNSSAHQILSNVKNGLKKFSLLFLNGMWKTTLPLCCLWFGAAWLYYGSVLLTTTILLENPHCDGNESVSNFSSLFSYGSGYDDNASNASHTLSCEDTQLDVHDYLQIIWTTLAELPGLLVTIFIIEIIGRKFTIIVNFMMIMLGLCLLIICTSDALLTFFLFIVRAFCTGVFQTMYVYTPEVYPTNIRGIGIGFASSMARIGAIITPYVAQVLFRVSDYATIGVYAGSCLVFIFVTFLLPLETKKKPMN